jgi:hypothetical protein
MIFLEVATQHATHEKQLEKYCPYKVCNNNVMYLYKDHEIICEHLVRNGFMDNYFIWSKNAEAQPRTESIIDEREEDNMNANHVYSHHDDGGDHDDVGENDVSVGAHKTPISCTNISSKCIKQPCIHLVY